MPEARQYILSKIQELLFNNLMSFKLIQPGRILIVRIYTRKDNAQLIGAEQHTIIRPDIDIQLELNESLQAGFSEDSSEVFFDAFELSEAYRRLQTHS